MTTSTETSGTLVVPVRLRALRVTDQNKNQAVQRWLPNFHMMEMGEPVEPPAFESLDPDWSRPDTKKPEHLRNNGVHLHWEIPAGLRRATPDRETGDLKFPAAPNRWLVYRWHGTNRSATAWIIESDHLDPRTGTSPYYLRERGTKTRIGRAVKVIENGVPAGRPWTEPAPEAISPLTAIGPGLPTFSLYQPYHRNVFSLHDPLAEIPAAEHDIPVTYMVVGWHSNPDQDPLRTTAVQRLGWVPTAEGTHTTSVYAGHLFGVSLADRPDDRIPAPGSINGAVGTSSSDALTHLATRAVSDHGKDVTRLVAALQNGILARMDDPDAEHLLDEYLHNAAFTPHPGGCRFELADRTPDQHTETDPGAPETSPRAADTDTYEQACAFLTELNSHQAAYEDLGKELRSLQRRLYMVWRLSNLPSRPGSISQDDFDKHLNPRYKHLRPERDAGYAARITALAPRLTAARDLVPPPVAHGSEDPATSWAHSRGLPARYALKRVLLEPFHGSDDPVVLLNNAAGEDPTPVDSALPCRPLDSLISDLKLPSGKTLAAYMGERDTLTEDLAATATPQTAHIPVQDAVKKIADEAWLCDPETAHRFSALTGGALTPTALRTAISDREQHIGSPPPFGYERWQQPWNPLYLVWKAEFLPLPYRADGAEQWTFDGTSYHWTGTAPDPQHETVALHGRAILGHHARFNLCARINDFLASTPDSSSELNELLVEFAHTVDSWNHVSQSLDGFAAQLTRHDPARALRPSGTTAPLVGSEHRAGPLPGPLPPPFGDVPASEFQETPAGQYRFTRLAVVDTFGRTATVYEPGSGGEGETFPLAVSPDITPERSARPVPQVWIEQHPRLPEPARLTVDFAHPEDDSSPYTTAGTLSPVIAWLIPNWLDNTLLAYTPNAEPVGEIRTTAGAEAPEVTWSTLPGTFHPAPPRLNNIYSALHQAGPDAFTDLMTAVFTALDTIHPADGASDTALSSILGRPLALVRIAVHLNSHADTTRDTPTSPTPRTIYRVPDPTWGNALKTDQRRAYGSIPWRVRLGDPGRLGDGLVGFWTDDTRPIMHAGYLPDSPLTDYVHSLTGDELRTCPDDGPTYLTALVDPRAPLHATTGILPTTRTHIPTRFVDPLNLIAPALRTGPLLVPVLPASADGTGTAAPTAVRVPVPSLRSGSWQWTELTAHRTWTSVPASTGNPEETFTLKPPTARSGFLTKTGKTTSSHEGSKR